MREEYRKLFDEFISNINGIGAPKEDYDEAVREMQEELGRLINDNEKDEE